MELIERMPTFKKACLSLYKMYRISGIFQNHVRSAFDTIPVLHCIGYCVGGCSHSSSTADENMANRSKRGEYVDVVYQHGR